MVQKNSFITVQAFMRNDLNLKGNELLIYALIYGFSQDGESEFTGSINYVCEWCGTSRPTVIKALQELTARGYIIKKTEVKNNVTFNRYSANLELLKGSQESLGVVKNLYGGSQESLLGGSKESLLGGSKETLPNINTSDIDNNDIDRRKDIKPARHKYGEYKNVLLSDLDMEKLKEEFPNDYAERIERLSCYMASTGKTYKNHLATIRNWARKDNQRKPTNQNGAYQQKPAGGNPFLDLVENM